MIEVVAAIIFRENRILIAKRKQGKHLAGFWEFPGGKIEVGESPEACLHREIKEELGIEIQVNNFLIENMHKYHDKTILLRAYICTYINGIIKLVDHEDAHWVTKTEIYTYKFAEADIPFLSLL